MLEHWDKKFYVDKRLYEDLKIYVNDVVKFNMDFLCVITGEESNGKSKLSRQIAWTISYILWDDHNIKFKPQTNDIHFNLDTYLKKSICGEKYQINILDESRSILNRKSSTTRESKKFTNYLSECRKFNQFHILCLPAMHDLDKYCFLWRSRYFIHVLRSRDENHDIVRGTYLVYPKDRRLMKCYEDNYYQYPKFNPKYGGFKGSFNDFEAFDNMKEYEEKQRQIMEEKYETKSEKKNKDVSLQILKKLVNDKLLSKTAIDKYKYRGWFDYLISENGKTN